MAFDDIEHLVIALGGLATLLGVLKMLAGWRAARDEGMVSRARQEEALRQITKEFKPNHGTSLIDRIVHIEHGLQEHLDFSEDWIRQNAEQYEAITRRIDALFVVLSKHEKQQRRRWWR